MGICIECGAPSRVTTITPEFLYMDSFCSQECSTENWARAEREGLVIKVSETTPEQMNELFKRSGLMLEGVGPREPS